MISPIGNSTTAEIVSQRGTQPSRNRQYLNLAVSILTILLTVRYIIWRVAINNWSLWWLSIPLLTAELLTAVHVLGYQFTVWPRRSRPLLETANAAELPIIFFIPTVNEGNLILEPTVRGALEASQSYRESFPDSSVRIIVCNDGYVAGYPDWRATEELANLLGVECITRETPGGAKAGNIENARRLSGASGQCLIVILDADQVPEPDFLLRTVPSFGDPTVGWVQTRQYYRNQESKVALWAEYQAALFYDLVCPGKSSLNASYICGTNVLIRAMVLDQIGGLPQESVTEDFAASIRTHHGWRSVYLKDVLAQGLGPLDLTGYYGQQSRWARGTLGVLRSDWNRILLPSRDGLEFGQRVQYFLSGTHYLCGIRDVIYLGSAVLCLFLNTSPIHIASIGAILSYLLPYIAASQLLMLLQVRPLSLMAAMCIGYGSFPTLVVSFFEAVTNSRMKFRITPKRATSNSDLPVITPHIAIAVVCIAAIIVAVITHKAWTPTDEIPLFWVVYSLIMLIPTFLLSRFTPPPIETKG